ncbi:Synaptotagmin-3 [Raphanus sativus]|nr:Synaptotagmin-3 [Raphanus sativus]
MKQVGGHDRLGMQMIPLKKINPREKKVFNLDLIKNSSLTSKDVEGKKKCTNPYALVLFRGEKKRTKMLKKTRDPRWNEEFQFTLEEPPLKESIRVEVMGKGTGFHFRSKEELGL